MVATPLLALLLAAPVRAAASAPAPGPPAAAPTLVTRLAAPGRLTVGDRFDLSLVVRAPKRSLITGPLAESPGVFVVAGETRATRGRPGFDETTYRLSLAGFAAGRRPLPRFAFFVESGARTDTLTSDTASVTIASVLPAKMQDVHGLAPPETFPNLLLWILPVAALLLAALAYLAHRLYRRFRTLREEAAAALPPWEEALAALEAMPWREWLEAGQAKRTYYTLSQILKRYIERRFEFDAVEQTTTELLTSMRLHKTPMRDDVARFFARYDLVKYAKLVPPSEEAESAIGQVREFVIRTRPIDTPAAAAGPGAPAPAAGTA